MRILTWYKIHVTNKLVQILQTRNAYSIAGLFISPMVSVSKNIFYCLSSFLFLASCQESAVEINKGATLFFKHNPSDIGITFQNNLQDSKDVNVYTFRNFYNGAGVGISDFNNDGLQDIFLCGNQVDNALYINQGGFQFEDVSSSAGVTSQNVWSTGVSLADVNGDGLTDIYVCKSGDIEGDNRHNELFINQGNSEEGPLTFKEQSKEAGLDDLGLSTHAAFFDYDLDGDLDCYLLNNSFRSVGNYDLRPNQREKRDPEGGNKLFKNQLIETGNLLFEDVSEKAGIYGSAIGFGLGVTIGDVNNDGWPDIFVSNDFFEKDYLYINNKNGSFTESVESYISELSMGSMGADIADLNNDGFPEIFVTEMLPATEQRLKSKAQFENWNKYAATIDNGYHRQFGRNVLQLNLAGKQFAEVGRLAGVEATDWSWGALLFDMDNDGNKDIFVANGIYKDLLDQDYINFYSNPDQVRQILFDEKGGIESLIAKIPSEAIPNQVFKNEGDLQFQDVAQAWGLNEKGFSNGASYADLDNDGDLDLVVNNINAAPFIYENTIESSNYLSVQLKYKEANPFGIGAKVLLYQNDQVQTVEIFTARGFMSSIPPIAHFGLGSADTVDSLIVQWPDYTRTSITNVDANTRRLVSYVRGESIVESPSPKPLYQLDKQSPLPFKHKEVPSSDFDKEALLFQMHNNLGPAVCTGDFNNDGNKDVFIGGAAGQAGRLFYSRSNGSFREIKSSDFQKHKASEDTDCACTDVNSDGYLDLYVTSGSTEFGPNNAKLADRLYINNAGKNMTVSNQILPSFRFENSSSVATLDNGKTGEQDLIVSTFVQHAAYGIPSNLYVLKNDGTGKLKRSEQPVFEDLGMLTAVEATDIDKDGDEDIICIGEWMKPILFLNEDGSFSRKDFGSVGLWSALHVADLDQDGDQDILVGNYGLNNRFSEADTFKLYVNDFDQNGKIEQVFSVVKETNEYPIAQRIDLLKQLPYLAKKYPDFKSYAGQQIADIFTPEQLKSGLVYKMQEFRSGVYWNEGNLVFKFEPLPKEAQYSVVMAFETLDINKDGKLDIICGGNQYNQKPEIGIQAASVGLAMTQTTDRKFESLQTSKSGILVTGETRGIVHLQTKTKEQLIFFLNNDSPKIFNRHE